MTYTHNIFVYYYQCLERKYYSKRLIIINEIKRVAKEQDFTLEEAVVTIENLRISLEGCSLDKLGKTIQAKNKQQ